MYDRRGVRFAYPRLMSSAPSGRFFSPGVTLRLPPVSVRRPVGALNVCALSGRVLIHRARGASSAYIKRPIGALGLILDMLPI